jgi:type III secretion protein J
MKRVSTALVAAMVAMAVGSVACSTNILHGADERSANEATSALERAGIGAEKVADEGGGSAGASYTVRVARGDSTRAVDLLRALGLPRDHRRGFSETYGQPSLIPTPSEERARYLDALAGEIERTLESADGIVSARVHLVLEESDPLNPEAKPRTPARAAVLLRARPGRAPLSELEVQRLVAGSVAGLVPSAVAVVTVPAGEPSDTVAAPLVALGPLRMTAGTRPLLLVGLLAALAVLAALAALLLYTARRLSAAERRAQANIQPSGG